jgi:hypothetical protein
MIISGDHVCFDFKIYCRGIGSGALIPVHSKCTEVGVWSLMTETFWTFLPISYAIRMSWNCKTIRNSNMVKNILDEF